MVQVAIAIWLAGAVLPLAAAEMIEVELIDGRRISGEWVNRDEVQRVWLMARTPGIEIRSSFLWSDVRSAKPHNAVNSVRKAPERASEGRRPSDKSAHETPLVPVHATRVKSLHIEARLAQWDDDVQPDGLQVLVFPRDASGALAAVNGEIELRLLGEIEPYSGGNHDPLTPKFRELERSTSIVRLADFADGAAVYNIPFSQFHPDFDLDVASSAIVHARLGVPGQGAFESSDAQVELRDFSRIRDQLQLHTPQRFFPIESGARWNR